MLHGHVKSNSSSNESSTIDVDEGDEDVGLGFQILEYEPRHWWRDDVPNCQYIRKHVSRHLRGAGFDLELGATVLDLRWICTQGPIGGVLGLKNDLDILQAVLEDNLESTAAHHPIVPVKIISDLVVASAAGLHLGMRVLHHAFFAHLYVFSKTNQWVHRFLERLNEVTPAPFLLPIVSFYRIPVDDLKFQMDLRLPNQNYFAFYTTDFSKCEKYCVAGANNDVIVFNLKNRSRLKWLKGHEKHVNVVKLSFDACKVISGSLDGNVIVWDWKENESQFLV